MPSKDWARRFVDILDEIDLINSFVNGRSAQPVAGDLMAVRAIERSLQIISEAATKLGEHAESSCPNQPWRQIRALGNVLRHGYDGLVFERLWHIIEHDLPSLRADCAAQAVLREE